jgi:hypothetical protein
LSVPNGTQFPGNLLFPAMSQQAHRISTYWCYEIGHISCTNSSDCTLVGSHHSRLLENLALRQQLVVLKPSSAPRGNLLDSLLWLLVRRCRSDWKQALLVVTPETLVRLRHAGFRSWSVFRRSESPFGRRQTSTDVRDLIFQMMAENPGLGAPRIHGELLMFGFEVSERTISRWMKWARRDPGPAKRWRYCLFVICHDRRRILHCNVVKLK